MKCYSKGVETAKKQLPFFSQKRYLNSIYIYQIPDPSLSVYVFGLELVRFLTDIEGRDSFFFYIIRTKKIIFYYL